MQHTGQILGTFSFADYDNKGPQSGIVITFYDSDGAETSDPEEAESWYGIVMDGSLKGHFINCPVEGGHWHKCTVH